MRLAILFVLLTTPFSFAQDWSPPKNPDLQSILNEAREDATAKRYDDALAKHVWFHKHSLEIDPSYYGVRLSFALDSWTELSKKYPPALVKLKEVRNESRKQVLAGTKTRESFHDMSSINEYLDEQSATVTTFKKLIEKNPKQAEQVFDIAQPALIREKAYKLVGKYIDPEKDFAHIQQRYQEGKKLAEDPQFGADYLQFENKTLANKTTTLIAILVVNDRKPEAEKIATTSRTLLDEKKFHKAINAALKGVVPKPWPPSPNDPPQADPPQVEKPDNLPVIPAGHKVIALGFTMANGLDGKVSPGDFVDIIKQNDDNAPTVIASNVKVYHVSTESDKHDLVIAFLVGPKSAEPVGQAIGDRSVKLRRRSNAN